jgi:hypothetical protein
MAAEDAIAALPDHWDDIMSRLSPEDAAELAGLVDELGAAERARVVTQIADILVQALPPDHPIRRALVSGDLLQSSAVDLEVVSRTLRERINLAGPSVLRVVTARLLEAPALSEDEVRRHGCDPDDPGLIRLDRPDGTRQWPEFQFAPSNGPYAVVRTINGLLGAESDPIGVADWWLSRNGWLDDRPSRLIGKISDERLVSAAAAVGLEV